MDLSSELKKRGKKERNKYLVKRSIIECDWASAFTSFHFSHFCLFFFFVSLFENDPKSRPFSCFVFCRTANLFTVAILFVLASTTWLVTLVAAKVTSDKSSKIFSETAVSANCHLSLPHRPTYHFSHLSLRETFPWLSRRSFPSLPYTKVLTVLLLQFANYTSLILHNFSNCIPVFDLYTSLFFPF